MQYDLVIYLLKIPTKYLDLFILIIINAIVEWLNAYLGLPVLIEKATMDRVAVVVARGRGEVQLGYNSAYVVSARPSARRVPSKL